MRAAGQHHVLKVRIEPIAKHDATQAAGQHHVPQVRVEPIVKHDAAQAAGQHHVPYKGEVLGDTKCHAAQGD